MLKEERNDHEKKDTLSVEDADKENNSEDCNAMVDLVLKKYKQCERAAPNPVPASPCSPRRTEGEQTPQDGRGGTSLPHGSSESVVESSSSSTRGRLQTPELALSSSPGKHSTPYPAKKNSLHDSLFGFEFLESPLVLTPLVLSPVKTVRDCDVEHTPRRGTERQQQQQQHTPRRGTERQQQQHWRSSAAVATVHAGPKQRHKTRNKAPEPSEQEDWIKRMNEEFRRAEAYDLVIQ